MTSLLRSATLLATAAVLAVGCVAVGNEQAATPPAVEAARPASWEGPPPGPETGGKLAVREFNALTEGSGEAWTQSAILVAVEYLRLDRADATSTSLVVDSQRAGGPRATATATLAGLADDSVRAVRFTLELERRRDGTWGLASAFSEQRCQPGRGHEDFDARPCV